MAKKSIAKNYFYNLIYQVLTLVLPLITTPYLARVLGPEGTGIYGYTYSIVTYFILFGSLGVAMYGQREIAYAQENIEARKKTFFEIVVFRFVTVFIATILYAIFFFRGNEYAMYYRILLLELIAAGFDISWFFQGMEEFKRTVTRNILVRIASVTCVFIFVKNREDLALFTFIYSLADLLGNLSLWLYVPKYIKGAKIGKIHPFSHLPQIILLFIPQISNQIYKILDTTMIGKIIVDKSETGFYEQGQKVIRLLLTVVTSLGVVMIPRMASMFASGDKKKINYYMKLSFNYVYFLAFPIMFGLMSVSDAFVPLFFGKGYDKVAILINIISPILILMGIANVIGTQYLLPTKRQKEYTISITIGVVVNFILNYVLISLYAAIGASIATVLSQLIIDIIQLYSVRKDINVKEMLFISWKYLVSSLVMFGVCFLVRFGIASELISNAIANLSNSINIELTYLRNVILVFAQAGIGAIAYIVMLIILKDDYLRMFVEKVKEKLFKRKKQTA